MLGVALILPGSVIPDIAQAACAPDTLCVIQAIDTGDIYAFGSFSWAITEANAGGNQTISFDSDIFSGANTTLTLSGTNLNGDTVHMRLRGSR